MNPVGPIHDSLDQDPFQRGVTFMAGGGNWRFCLPANPTSTAASIAVENLHKPGAAEREVVTVALGFPDGDRAAEHRAGVLAGARRALR